MIYRSFKWRLPLSGGSVRFNLSATETTAVGASSKVMQLASIFSATVANGSQNSQGNVVASISGTIGTSPTTINLKTLTLAGATDPIAFATIKGMIVQETTSPVGTNYLLMGDSTGTLTNAFTGFLNTATGVEKISSGGARAFYDVYGFTVGASTYLLQLAANSGTATYQIDIIGAK